MPLYEYSCPRCKNRFEHKSQTFKAKDKRHCPECGALCPKVMSAPNFQFSQYLKELGGNNLVSY